MYRIRLADGTLTDMVNLTRAKDALLKISSTTMNYAQQVDQIIQQALDRELVSSRLL
jgi:hypothetical protein